MDCANKIFKISPYEMKITKVYFNLEPISLYARSLDLIIRQKEHCLEPILCYVARHEIIVSNIALTVGHVGEA